MLVCDLIKTLLKQSCNYKMWQRSNKDLTSIKRAVKYSKELHN